MHACMHISFMFRMLNISYGFLKITHINCSSISSIKKNRKPNRKHETPDQMPATQ